MLIGRPFIGSAVCATGSRGFSTHGTMTTRQVWRDTPTPSGNTLSKSASGNRFNHSYGECWNSPATQPKGGTMKPKYSKFSRETRQLAYERTNGIRSQILDEIDRLLRSGAVDSDSHNRGLLFGVAVENIADKWLSGERKTADYRNLKRF